MRHDRPQGAGRGENHFVTNGAKTAVKLSAIISKLTANGVFRLTHDGKAATFTLGQNMADVSAILTRP